MSCSLPCLCLFENAVLLDTLIAQTARASWIDITTRPLLWLIIPLSRSLDYFCQITVKGPFERRGRCQSFLWSFWVSLYFLSFFKFWKVKPYQGVTHNPSASTFLPLRSLWRILVTFHVVSRLTSTRVVPRTTPKTLHMTLYLELLGIAARGEPSWRIGIVDARFLLHRHHACSILAIERLGTFTVDWWKSVLILFLMFLSLRSHRLLGGGLCCSDNSVYLARHGKLVV